MDKPGGNMPASRRESSTTGGAGHPAIEMKRALAGLVDRRDDTRMVVAERGAHLARGEIEDFPAFGVPHQRPRALAIRRGEVHAIADEMLVPSLVGELRR